MSQRIDYRAIEPAAYDALRAQYNYVHSTKIAPTLLHLIDVRVSQINGCAFCLDLHTREARAAGETEQRLYTLSVWRETSFFSPEERAVLALAESVTRIADNHLPDSVYEEVKQFFSPQEIVQLIMATISINSWNRIGIALQLEPKLRHEHKSAV